MALGRAPREMGLLRARRAAFLLAAALLVLPGGIAAFEFGFDRLEPLATDLRVRGACGGWREVGATEPVPWLAPSR